MKYIFLPDVRLQDIKICGEYKQWLEDWLYELNENIERESVSSSECIQGLLCENLLGKETIDWQEVEKTLLRDNAGRPMAYSEAYGRRLYKFDSQWRQMPVYAIYNSFWMSRYYGGEDTSAYQRLIVDLIQPNGWIYNPKVSNTQLRTRMKSELLMSLAMGTEILLPDRLDTALKDRFEAVLAGLPLTGYVSAEYFRMEALKNIQRLYQFPEGLADMLEKCEAGDGYNDFCVWDKTDDYMGTRKRTQHDAAIHTPLITNMARMLSIAGDVELVQRVDDRMRLYAGQLRRQPMDIPAFRMRDIEFPFGTGISPLELISASVITDQY